MRNTFYFLSFQWSPHTLTASGIKWEYKSRTAQKLSLLVLSFIAEGAICDDPQSEDVLSCLAASSPSADTSSQFEIIAPKAADQNITVVVLSDDYGTGSVPWGEFHYVAVISCQRSLGRMQKIPSWQDFSAGAQEFCVGKVLRGK